MRKILYILLLVIGISSCETSSKDFLESIQANVADAELKVNEYDLQVQDAFDKKDLQKIVPLADDVTKELVDKIEKVNKLDAPKEGEDMKSSAVSYLESLIDFVQSEKIYLSYTETIKEDEAMMMDNKVGNVVKSVEINRTILSEYQQAFIKEKGLK